MSGWDLYCVVSLAIGVTFAFFSPVRSESVLENFCIIVAVAVLWPLLVAVLLVMLLC